MPVAFASRRFTRDVTAPVFRLPVTMRLTGYWKVVVFTLV